MPGAPAARRYRPGTATIETSWERDGARLTLTEGMVAEPRGRLLPASMLVRRLDATGGAVRATIEFDPRFGDKRRRTARRATGERARVHLGRTRGLPARDSRPDDRARTCR